MGGPDLVTDLLEGLVVGGSDDAGKDPGLARDLPLDPGQQVHVVEQDQVLVVVAAGSARSRHRPATQPSSSSSPACHRMGSTLWPAATV
jgi:hypothetical protein